MYLCRFAVLLRLHRSLFFKLACVHPQEQLLVSVGDVVSLVCQIESRRRAAYIVADLKDKFGERFIYCRITGYSRHVRTRRRLEGAIFRRDDTVSLVCVRVVCLRIFSGDHGSRPLQVPMATADQLECVLQSLGNHTSVDDGTVTDYRVSDRAAWLHKQIVGVQNGDLTGWRRTATDRQLQDELSPHLANSTPSDTVSSPT